MAASIPAHGDVGASSAPTAVATPHKAWHKFAGKVEPHTSRSTRAHSKISWAEPLEIPDGFVMKVHGVTDQQGGDMIGSLRTTAAAWLAPNLPDYVWAKLLGHATSELDRWPGALLRARQLRALGRAFSHGAMDDLRTTICGVRTFRVNHEGAEESSALDQPVGYSTLDEYLEMVDEEAHARQLQILLTKGEVTEDAKEAAGGHATAKRLRCLKTASERLFLDWDADHPSLACYATHPSKRDAGEMGPPAEISDALHFEIGAADESLPYAMRCCHAMAAASIHCGVRFALASRCTGLVDAPRGLGTGRAGIDPKKNTFRQAGRGLLCSTAGWWGCTAWWELAKVVAELGLKHGIASLILDHDGRGGNPALATRLTLSRPSRDAWATTLSFLQRSSVSIPCHSGARMTISPSLCSPERLLTPHSLKFAKACGFGASGVHSTYISEPGAWSGSWLERQSQSGEGGDDQAQPLQLRVAAWSMGPLLRERRRPGA